MANERALKRGRKGYLKRYCGDMIAYFGSSPQNILTKRSYHPDGTLKSEEPVVIAGEFPTFQGLPTPSA